MKDNFFLRITAQYLKQDNTVRKLESLIEIEGPREDRYYDGIRECLRYAQENIQEGEMLMGTNIRPEDLEKHEIILK